MAGILYQLFFIVMNKGLLVTVGSVLLVVVIGGAILSFSKRNTPDVSQETKTYKIGILNGYDFFGATATGFKEKMTELGFVEGKNVTYDTQKTNVSLDEYRNALQKFASDGVDLILTFPTEASIEGRHIAESSGIPVVFSNANVEGVDLIDSIQAPGHNVTGVRYPGPDIALRRLEVIMDLVPGAKTVLVPYDATYPNVPPQTNAIHEVAPSLSVELIELPVSSPEELKTRLDALVKDGRKIDAILTLAEPLSATPAYVDVYGKFAEDRKIPWGGALTLKKDGYNHESLFGISVDSTAVGAQAAVLAEKILVGGISAGTIPVVSAEGILEVNYSAAQKMGITPEEGLLSGAHKVYR